MTQPWDFSAQLIYYRHSDLPVRKIHQMYLRLFYNALGGLYMCWAHFICSYISQEEFSVRLMGTVHCDWVTCRDKWAGGNGPRKWIISISKQIPTFLVLFPSDKKHFHYPASPRWFRPIMYSHLPPLIDPNLDDGTEIIFSHQVMGVSGSIFSLLLKLLQPLEYQLRSIPLT